MILKSLRLTYFKNHENASFEFGNHINCILGQNGKGKTNLLDAIYYLSFTKSGVGTKDKLAITHGAKAFTLFGCYDGQITAIQFEKGKPKVLKINGKQQERLSDLIGKVPLVMILPDDTNMIKEGGDERRKFFDGALCQVDQEYLHALLKYTKLLKQRNSLLKQEGGKALDFQLLETYSDQMITLAVIISSKRRSLLKVFEPFLQKIYSDLHDGNETPILNFRSHVDDAFTVIFKESLPKDQLMQRTLLGSHRDDFEFLLDGQPIKSFGSQGQQKTFIISLKLALYDFLSERTQKKPVLLLDDIFDRLDDSRIQFLVSMLKDERRFRQIFITDAREDRSKQLFKNEKDVKFVDIT